MLEGRDIGVRIGDAALLRQVDIHLSSGEIAAVVGPNGAGKSTLLKVLTGALRPTEGYVLMRGRRIGDWSRLALARQRAVLSQKIELALPFSAMEVVLLGRAPYRGLVPRDHDVALALTAMRESGTADLAGRAYTSLSGGEQQRVHLARVLSQIWRPRDSGAHDERYLFLDEPTASLDMAHQHATLRTARRLAEDGVGVLAVLHDLNLAAMYADRLYLMKGGRIAAEGTADRVMDVAILEHVFELPLTVSRHPTRGCPQIAAT